jgi:hypothetical protein
MSYFIPTYILVININNGRTIQTGIKITKLFNEIFDMYIILYTYVCDLL